MNVTERTDQRVADAILQQISILDSQPRSASVEAVEDSLLLSLHRRDLLPFLERNPKAALKLAGVLATHVRRLSELVEDTVFLGLPSRLAKKLLSLAQRYGKETPEGVLIDLKLPQHELRIEHVHLAAEGFQVELAGHGR